MSWPYLYFRGFLSFFLGKIKIAACDIQQISFFSAFLCLAVTFWIFQMMLFRAILSVVDFSNCDVKLNQFLAKTTKQRFSLRCFYCLIPYPCPFSGKFCGMRAVTDIYHWHQRHRHQVVHLVRLVICGKTMIPLGVAS